LIVSLLFLFNIVYEGTHPHPFKPGVFMTSIQRISYEGKEFNAYTEASDRFGTRVPTRTHRRVVCIHSELNTTCNHDKEYKTLQDMHHDNCVLIPIPPAPEEPPDHDASSSTISSADAYRHFLRSLCAVIACSNLSFRQASSATFVAMLQAAMMLQLACPDISPQELLGDLSRKQLHDLILQEGCEIYRSRLKALEKEYVSIVMDAGTAGGRPYKVIMLVPSSTEKDPVLIDLDQSPGTRQSYIDAGIRAVLGCWTNGVFPAAFVTDGLLHQVEALSLSDGPCVARLLAPFSLFPVPLHAPCLCHRIQLAFLDAQFLSPELKSWVSKIQSAADALRRSSSTNFL
jgi:glycine cleavage system regulatory protein